MQGSQIDKHEDVLNPRPAFMGSSTQEVDANAVQKAWRARLIQLGLTEEKLKTGSRGESPEVDRSTGDWKRGTTDVTWLGRMLLGYIGIEEPLRGGESKESDAA